MAVERFEQRKVVHAPQFDRVISRRRRQLAAVGTNGDFENVRIVRLQFAQRLKRHAVAQRRFHRASRRRRQSPNEALAVVVGCRQSRRVARHGNRAHSDVAGRHQFSTARVCCQIPHANVAVLIARDEFRLIRMQHNVVDRRIAFVFSLTVWRSTSVNE